jgi:hypothetical protein
MPGYAEHARAIAAELSQVDGLEVVPDPPQTPMMHLHLRTTPAAVTAGVRRLAGRRPEDVPELPMQQIAERNIRHRAPPPDFVA